MTTDLFIQGISYISVRRASEETGYAQDYIGQLSRQKKIPAKLVGRTWFVDIDALNKYKNGGTLSESTSTQKSVEEPTHLGSTSVVNEAQSQFELPKLIKKSRKSIGSFKLHRDPAVIALSLVVTVFVIGNTVTSWISYLTPELLVSGGSASVALVEESLSTGGGSVGESLSEGMVVFPEDEDTKNKIQNIKSSFSDEVEVFFDEGGESGVIRPVFRSAGDTDNYAFVLVPVKQPTMNNRQ